MVICVTGGSGFVGRAIVDAALQEGHSPRVLGRAGNAGPTPASARRTLPQPERIQVDYGNVPSLVSAMRGSDALIHLVGIISEARHRTFYQAHVATTAKVLEAAGRCGIRRVVHMSALGTRSGARSGYHRTKWEGEELVRASGLDWTILRPSLIYGPDDHFTTLFARISRWSPVLPVMGEGRALLQPVSVGTVARAFVHAVPCREAVGRTLDLCGPERLTFPALLRQIGEACGRRRRLFHIPMSVARLQARALEICLGSVLGVPPPLNRDQLLMLEEDNIGDGTEADRLFGLVHPTLRDALRGQFAGSRG